MKVNTKSVKFNGTKRNEYGQHAFRTTFLSLLVVCLDGCVKLQNIN